MVTQAAVIASVLLLRLCRPRADDLVIMETQALGQNLVIMVTQAAVIASVLVLRLCRPRAVPHRICVASCKIAGMSTTC